MVIPLGINQRTFLKEAEKKGIKISSRYTNVYITKIKRGYIYWVASKYIDGKTVFQKRFPFNEVGERTAYLAVQNYLKSINHE